MLVAAPSAAVLRCALLVHSEGMPRTMAAAKARVLPPAGL